MRVHCFTKYQDGGGEVLGSRQQYDWNEVRLHNFECDIAQSSPNAKWVVSDIITSACLLNQLFGSTMYINNSDGPGA